MWLGEQVSERGIGNGISIIIATSILTGIPGAIGQALEQSRQGDISVSDCFIAIGTFSNGSNSCSCISLKEAKEE